MNVTNCSFLKVIFINYIFLSKSNRKLKREKRKTCIFKKIQVFTRAIITGVPLATYDLQKQNSKAVDIIFHGVDSFFNIFRRNIATAYAYINKIFFKYLKKEKERKTEMLNLIAYYVPTILPVLASSTSFLKSLAIPKSEILGFNSLSNKMLLAFKSL